MKPLHFTFLHLLGLKSVLRSFLFLFLFCFAVTHTSSWNDLQCWRYSPCKGYSSATNLLRLPLLHSKPQKPDALRFSRFLKSLIPIHEAQKTQLWVLWYPFVFFCVAQHQPICPHNWAPYFMQVSLALLCQAWLADPFLGPVRLDFPGVFALSYA